MYPDRHAPPTVGEVRRMASKPSRKLRSLYGPRSKAPAWKKRIARTVAGYRFAFSEGNPEALWRDVDALPGPDASAIPGEAP